MSKSGKRISPYSLMLLIMVGVFGLAYSAMSLTNLRNADFIHLAFALLVAGLSLVALAAAVVYFKNRRIGED